MEVYKIRYKLGFRSVRRDHLEVTSCPVVSRQLPGILWVGRPAFALPPSHIPSDGLLVGRTPERARGPLLIFRKIHLYGKTKKSTHGHQTTKPFCTHFFNASSDYSILDPLSQWWWSRWPGRLWRARGRLEAGSRVGRPTLAV